MKLTKEQKAACNIKSLDDIDHMSIVACAGSGKTFTATRRLFEIYKLLRRKEAIALFSYSNIAVSTFYNALTKILPIREDNPVHISTVDSFLTEYIIKPHGKRKMGCSCSPFLVSGAESFLKWPQYSLYVEANLKGRLKKIPFKLTELHLKPSGSKIGFYVSRDNIKHNIEEREAFAKILAVGKLGGYTHALRSLWAALILKQEPKLISIISQKFPYILIDEAQDIGFLHGHIFEELSKKSKITLIGDPHQAIYSFAHADGSFLNNFARNKCGGAKPITYNWRSIEAITLLASNLSNIQTKSKRLPQNDFHGVFYRTYAPGEEGSLGVDYADLLRLKEYNLQDSAVLCRSNDVVNKILCNNISCGEGITRQFAESAIERDTLRETKTAFNKLIRAIFSLMEETPADLPKILLNAHWDVNSLSLRRALWTFWRSPETGLPASSWPAKTEWLTRLRINLRVFLPFFSDLSGLKLKETWGKSIRSNSLPDGPLHKFCSQPKTAASLIRVDTVHKAKGESLDSVLYVVTKSHLNDFLEGTETEEGRIGYVALTRARELFVLAIPISCLKTHGAKLAKLKIVPLPPVS